MGLGAAVQARTGAALVSVELLEVYCVPVTIEGRVLPALLQAKRGSDFGGDGIFGRKRHGGI